MRDMKYNGLGFSVTLKRVETREFQGETIPVINHRELEDRVFRTLLYSPFHFSSAHLAFVRGYMGISQKGFAAILGLSAHSTISGWESKGDKASGMPQTTELVVRLLMADYIKDSKFAESFKEYLSVSLPPEEFEVA